MNNKTIRLLVYGLGFIFLSGFLSGCTTVQADKREYSNYMDNLKSKYNSGRISPKYYYTKVYEKTLNTNFPNQEQKAMFLDFASSMIDAATKLSDKKITEDDFYKFEKNLKAIMDSRHQALEQKVNQGFWERVGRVGQTLVDMDMQRIQNHNAAVRSHKASFPENNNVYDSDGQLRAYSVNGNWYSSDGTYAGFIKNDNIYGTDGQLIGFRKGKNYYNADGSYAGYNR